MSKNHVFLLVSLFNIFFLFGQKSYQIRTVAFYNLENLFDTIDNPNTEDESSPIMNVKFNRSDQYQLKVSNMAKVISEIGKSSSGTAPDIIGIAEIENERVLNDLINTPDLKRFSYQFIHYESPDLRGIDVALLFRENVFRPIDHDSYEVGIWDEKGIRLYTRDILWVAGYLENELIHVLVNHWPSRRGGVAKSSYRREKAAYVCRQIIERIQKEYPDTKIIVMGDFNDDPINASIKDVLVGQDNSPSPTLYNPMDLLFRKGHNTLVYRDQINLFDQIIVSATLIDKERKFTTFSICKVGIFRPSYLTTAQGRFKGYPFRSFGPFGFTGGYSDHYPVYIQLARKL